jgi:hypothetical protein
MVGVGGGANSYDGEKAWSSINHSILSGGRDIVQWTLHSGYKIGVFTLLVLVFVFLQGIFPYPPSPPPPPPLPLPHLKPPSQPPSSPSPSRTHQLHQKLTVFIREEMQQGVQGIYTTCPWSQTSKAGTIGDYSINSNRFVSVDFVYNLFSINTRRGVSVLSFFICLARKGLNHRQGN